MTNQSGVKGRILILEDDADLAFQWAKALRDAHFSVELAATRVEADAWIEKQPFDLVIADIYIKRSDGKLLGDGGITLINHIRSSIGQSRVRRDTPIIAVTGIEASFGFDPLQLAYAAKATELLRKPFAPHELVLLVQQLL